MYDAVIWLDPGKTTGWASYGFGQTFMSGQADFAKTGDMIEAYAELYRDGLAVGCENYIETTTGSQRGRAEYSLKTIGMVEWLCLRHGAVLLPTMPSSSRNLGRTGGKLHKLGWHKPGQDHANDAAAHLLTWLLKENRLPTEDTDKLFV